MLDDEVHADGRGQVEHPVGSGHQLVDRGPVQDAAFHKTKVPMTDHVPEVFQAPR